VTSRDHWRIVATLAITQTVGYGVLSYAFAVFLAPMAADLHTSVITVTGAATLAVLVSAAGAVPVGRWVDRHGGRALMSAGSVLAVGAVFAWSQARDAVDLYAAFGLIGVASAMVLYEPAFAIIVTRFDPVRRSTGLLAVTVVAGFASSIFLPLAGILNAHLGWRHAVAVLAAILAAATIAPHLLVLPGGAAPVRAGSLDRSGPGAAALRAVVVRAALRDKGFWLLAIAFVAHGGALSIVAVHLVSYLTTLGHPPAFAAAVAGLLGVLSVTGRLVTTGLRRWYATTTVTAAVFALQAGAIAVLPLVGRDAAGAIVCVVLFGLGFGVATIARPALLAERYDTAGYATLAGALALPATVAKAGAPLAAAVISATGGGYPAVMVTVATACLVAAVALGLVKPAGPRRARPSGVG
jgi:predicted MFS family arabinose efflux permease